MTRSLMILVAGPYRSGTDGDHDEAIFHPVPERVLEHCDGCLRIGGPSAGADRMVETARRLGLTVYTDLEQVP